MANTLCILFKRSLPTPTSWRYFSMLPSGNFLVSHLGPWSVWNRFFCLASRFTVSPIWVFCTRWLKNKTKWNETYPFPLVCSAIFIKIAVSVYVCSFLNFLFCCFGLFVYPSASSTLSKLLELYKSWCLVLNFLYLGFFFKSSLPTRDGVHLAHPYFQELALQVSTLTWGEV